MVLLQKMSFTRLMLTLLLGGMFIDMSAAYKALFVMASGGRSHINYYGSIIEALEQNGHEITFVSPFNLNLHSKRIRKLVVEDIRENSLGNRFQLDSIKLIHSLHYVPKQCLNVLTNPEVVSVMKEDYDFVILPIFYSDCFLGYVHERKIPLINVTPNVVISPFSERIGLPDFWSVYPSILISSVYPVSFFERVSSTVMTIATYINFMMINMSTERLCREQNVWSSDTPPISALQKQGSLTISNSIRALEAPIKLTPPTLIYAGGIHIKPPKPLAEDLENWLNGSGDQGFILFSLGTAVKSAQMKEEHLKIILNVFQSLDQRIIWKWDSDIRNVSSNIKFSPWLPQQDILAHPNIRLFITHGGLFSTQEAMYNGVPVIGLPVFGDQQFNVARVVADGWGRQIMWDELTEDNFRAAINETLTDGRLRQTVADKSKLMRDWPTKPSEEVVYWIEYVIRHNGARHLRSPLIDLYWYKIYNVDVWLLILSVLVALLVLILSTIRFCVRFIKRMFKVKFD